VYGIDKSGIGLPLSKTAFKVGTGFHGGGGGVGHIGREVMTGVDVGYRGAIANDMPVKVLGIAHVIAQ
jgi:hypothetical protein